ncbi:MAG: HAD-IA family hydrolase [Candidatus Zixiibacteriota bacterium]
MTKAIIFDFDYTLADSSRGVILCVNHALGKLGLPNASDNEIKKTIGFTLPEIVVYLAGNEHGDKADDFVRHFINKADEVMTPMARMFESVPTVMRNLRDDGYLLGIVSTKFRYRIQEILQRESLLDCFDIIVGGEDVTAHKPDPEGLRKVMSDLSLNRDELIFVGDSEVDAKAAGNAGVRFVAVLSGVTPKLAFDLHESIAILNDLSQLPGALRDLLGAVRNPFLTAE